MFAVGLYTTRQRSGRAGLSVRIVVAVTAAVALCALTFYLVPHAAVRPAHPGLTGLIAIS